MTDDEVMNVCRAMLDRARTFDETGRAGRGSEAARAWSQGKAAAYRGAEELLRTAWQRSREAAK